MKLKPVMTAASTAAAIGLSLAFAPTLVRALLLDGPLTFADSAAKSAGAAGPGPRHVPQSPPAR